VRREKRKIKEWSRRKEVESREARGFSGRLFRC